MTALMTHLSNREKKYLMTGGISVLILLMVQLIYFPAVDKKKELTRILEIRKEALTEIRKLQKQYQQISWNMDSQKDVIAARDKEFSLFSFLDQQAQKSGVKQKVAYMQPFNQESDQAAYSIAKVKLKLNDLGLKELVEFLSRVESGQNGVFVTSLSLSKTGTGQDLLEAIIETRTVMPKGAL